MSSTNKTSNYELSQFLGTDKPAWLSDYNADMLAIDTQMKANADAASAAAGTGTTNSTAIGTLANLTTDAKTNLVAAINEVDAHADTAQGTASSANTTATSAYTIANAVKEYLDLTQTSAISSNTPSYVTISRFDLRQAINAGGTLGKVYGIIECTPSSTTASVSFATAFRPTETITVESWCWKQRVNSSTEPRTMYGNTVTIATDGTMTITLATNADDVDKAIRVYVFPFLIFADNFGDTIVNP